MRTAIIILNYNDYKTTIDMLEQIKNYNSLDLIVVVDNNSTDNSYEQLKKFKSDKISIIKMDKNLGYAAGNNFGLCYLEDKNIDYVIISNPDIEVKESVIEKLKLDLNTKNEVVLVAPIVYENGNISRGWKLPHFKEDLLSNINYFHKYSTKLLKYSNDYYNQELVPVEAVSGCFFAIKYAEFKEINFFDSRTFLYYEENILGSRLKQKQLKSYIDTKVSIKHNLSVSVDKSYNSLKKYKILKNSQIYYEKEYNHLNVLGIFVLRIFYYISYFISFVSIKLSRRK